MICVFPGSAANALIATPVRPLRYQKMVVGLGVAVAVALAVGVRVAVAVKVAVGVGDEVEVGEGSGFIISGACRT